MNIKKLKQRMNKYYKAFESDIQDLHKNPGNYPEEDKVEEVISVSGSEGESKSSDNEEDDDVDENRLKQQNRLKE